MSMTFSIRITDRSLDRNLLVSFDKETKWNSNSLRAWLCRKYAELNGGEIYIYINEPIPAVIAPTLDVSDDDESGHIPADQFCTCCSHLLECCTCDDVSDADYPILAQVAPQAAFDDRGYMFEDDEQFEAFCDADDSHDYDADYPPLVEQLREDERRGLAHF